VVALHSLNGSSNLNKGNHKVGLLRYSFICQGTSTRRQRSDLFGLRVTLPPVTTSLTTQT